MDEGHHRNCVADSNLDSITFCRLLIYRGESLLSAGGSEGCYNLANWQTVCLY